MEKVLCNKTLTCKHKGTCGGVEPHDFDPNECNKCPMDSEAKCQGVKWGGSSMGKLFTIQQVMAQLHISDETIYRYIRKGKIKAIRVGSLWRISSEALDEFLKKGEQNTHESNQ